MVRLLLLAAIALLSNVQSLTSAPAQIYPTRTVRFIVPFGAASGTDITARLFADRLAACWGKPVLVENRPGAAGLDWRLRRRQRRPYASVRARRNLYGASL